MADLNIAVDIPVHPQFNIDNFKAKVQEFAKMLVIVMSKQEGNANKCNTQAEALSFIQSLAVPGGESVPENINPLECLVDSKYEK